MPYSENSSLLETLLLTPCLLTGETRCEESKASIWAKPQTAETMLFFHIDDQSNPDCHLRQYLYGNRTGENICDCIVFYAKGNERVFCFVELKDNIKDLGKATKQLINTYNHFKQCLRLKYISKACIVAAGGSSLQEHQKYKQDLLRVFCKDNVKFIQRKSLENQDEFGDFLRGIPSKRKGKKKGKR